MDDRNFERWTATLEGLRQERKNHIQEKIKSLGPQFTAGVFYEIAKANLDDICLKWWFLSQESWEKNPPSDTYVELANLKEEVDSLVDLEIEAIQHDLEETRGMVNLSEKDVLHEKPTLDSYADDLKKTYKIKMDSLLGDKKSKMDMGKAKPVSQQMVSSGSSSAGVLTMFLFGLLLGGGAAYYYWDLGEKAAMAHQEEIQKVQTQVQNLVNRIELIQESFSGVAYGKVPTIPEIKNKMKPIQDRAAADRAQVERNFANKRKNILQHMPPGDKQDRSIQALEKEKQAQLEKINDRERRQLEPHAKKLAELREMLGEAGQGL